VDIGTFLFKSTHLAWAAPDRLSLHNLGDRRNLRLATRLCKFLSLTIHIQKPFQNTGCIGNGWLDRDRLAPGKPKSTLAGHPFLASDTTYSDLQSRSRFHKTQNHPAETASRAQTSSQEICVKIDVQQTLCSFSCAEDLGNICSKVLNCAPEQPYFLWGWSVVVSQHCNRAQEAKPEGSRCLGVVIPRQSLTT
jgi:hypothetical protein